jgi:L-ribulose-5-phosphate 3-epimerase
MSNAVTRRMFLGGSAAALLAQAAGARPSPLPLRKGIYAGMLPRQLSWAERFQLARDCGFQEVECETAPDPGEAEQIKAASEKAGLRIHSVMNTSHRKFPLSSAEAAVVSEGAKGIETSLRNARLWGADAILLVPARVDAQTSYREAWNRSQEHIRRLVPLAAELQVIIAIEEVWNKFLLSPLEFARYVDDFHSPWVRAYFDVGNILIWGYPQDWIRTLGKRIVKLHIKDFTFRDRIARFVNLGDGEIDWPEVVKALQEIGYSGSATVELEAGDAAYLRDVSRRFDRVLGLA